GAMLRINIDKPSKNKPYSIPADNPFINKPNALPEIWAYGFKNPWRYSFDNQNRLIVGDIGQHWEELNIVEKGFNMGWNIREGSHCFPPNTICESKNFIDPVYEYNHTEGGKIIAGYIFDGVNEDLKGKFIFGDMLSGKLWAA